ncbi:Imm49 family immunity protein [Comamonas sp. CMM02]|uniref:Imm49 family immunity protein n=1 Tax=Comamonas sp. CMM02 TaxID=2769307 RepID=UPI0017808B55|nr:Imm49 family immunity protein [Comamonas sp. CMM02]MBD9402820.1 immunity 49 family protein [Comamonas sp. CMM02]
MFISDYQESLNQGLTHVKGWGDPSTIERAIELLENNEGSRVNCLTAIERFFKCKAIISFFEEKDYYDFKKNVSIASKISIMIQADDPSKEYLSKNLIWPLVSENKKYIDWWCKNDSMFTNVNSGGGKDLVGNWLFYRYQIWLAINSKWNELGERSEKLLSCAKELKKDRAYIIDYEFYLALSRGDKASMQNIILEKCTVKNRRLRYEKDSGLTRDVICTYATMFAKLAKISGFELTIDSPWVPNGWVSTSSVGEVKSGLKFIDDYDVSE